MTLLIQLHFKKLSSLCRKNKQCICRSSHFWYLTVYTDLRYCLNAVHKFLIKVLHFRLKICAIMSEQFLIFYELYNVYCISVQLKLTVNVINRISLSKSYNDHRILKQLLYISVIFSIAWWQNDTVTDSS